MGNRVERVYDCGVAGLHRLVPHLDRLNEANVIIAVAGMEGALPSVIGGLVDRPVIAVPTSVGYGASFGGVAALLAMLNSCAPGVSVVNIDNGYGAAAQANQINKLAARSADHAHRVLRLSERRRGGHDHGRPRRRGRALRGAPGRAGQARVAGLHARAARGHEGRLPGDQGGRARPRSRRATGGGARARAIRTGGTASGRNLGHPRADRRERAPAGREGGRGADLHEAGRGRGPRARDDAWSRSISTTWAPIDAIVDVTGACIGLDLLGVDAVHCSALPVGGGFVTGAHGRMPIPGPGTAELLKGFPVDRHGREARAGDPDGRGHPDDAVGLGRRPCRAMTVEAVGYGAGDHGSRDAERDPRLRGRGGTSPADAKPSCRSRRRWTTCSRSSGKSVMERLFDAGALDVYLTPVTMKKSRPGIVLTALCAPEKVTELSRVLFEESPTIGVRWTAYQRERLDREMVTLATAYGPVAFQGLAAGRPRGHGHAGVRRGPPDREGEGTAGPRGARPGARRRPAAAPAMICAACRHDNPERAKFCLECGQRLAAACPQCGTELPPAAKFCLECGHRLGAVDAPAGIAAGRGASGRGLPGRAWPRTRPSTSPRRS